MGFIRKDTGEIIMLHDDIAIYQNGDFEKYNKSSDDVRLRTLSNSLNEALINEVYWKREFETAKELFIALNHVLNIEDGNSSAKIWKVYDKLKYEKWKSKCADIDARISRAEDSVLFLEDTFLQAKYEARLYRVREELKPYLLKDYLRKPLKHKYRAGEQLGLFN